jgi:hypothetical protein
LSTKNKNFVDGLFTVEGEYDKDNTPILLKNKFGFCKSTPNNLYRGIRPDITSAIDKNLYFTNMSKSLHGDKYDYSKVLYTGNENKVEIVCPIHGSFFQSPHTHLDKSGCPECGKRAPLNTSEKTNTFTYAYWVNSAEKSKHFDKYKVYIVRIFDDNEDFVKIGRTFTNTDRRLKDIPYNYEIVKIWNFYHADQAFDIENEIKKKLKGYRYKPLKKFGGHCECYTTNVIFETDITETVGLPDLVHKIIEYEYGVN